MANYKIPQDVEAEDKLLGPFTFRQFIFLLIAAASIFVAWLLSRINGWLTLIPLPVILVFGFLGIYRREDQPVEIYLLAALNFFLKPHRRVWGPEGATENVKLVIPPKQAAPKIKRLEGEERGQLEKLAHVMDTRGWSVKRPELNEPAGDQSLNYDDRLVSPQDSGNQEPLDIHSSDDVLDPVNFPDAQKYRQLAETTHTQARARAIKQMKRASLENQISPQDAPPKIQYQPYPAGTKQANINPQTGRLNPKHATKSNSIDPSSRHLELAKSDHLSVHHLAQQAKRIKKQTGELTAGQEIDLPNRGENPAGA